MKYFSMFSGVGGFELGIHRATKGKWECIGFSEIDKYAIQTYKKHFPNHKNNGSATKINPEELPDFDMLCGGFPCQAFSVAGKRKGFDDTRGTLFFEIVRIAKAKRPKILFLENVKGLLNHDKGKTFTTILQALAELGYDVQWQVLNSKFFGVPQNRERVFIIGNLRRAGQGLAEILPFKGTDTESNLKYVGAVMSEQNKQWLQDGKELSRNFPQGQRVYDTKGIASTIAGNAGGLGGKTGLYAVPLRFLQRNQRNYQGDYSFSLDSSNTGGVNINQSIRRLTPTECERLQGFPDDWTEGVSDTQRYKQMGNAVTVNVIEAITRRLRQSRSS